MKNLKKIKVFITDDHDVVIDGLIALLQSENDIQIVGRANNGKQLIEMLKNKPVDLVLMDIDMPIMNGVEATSYLKKNFPEIKVLILTMYNTPEFIANLLRIGADGYLLKNTRKKELVAAIRMVTNGQSFYAPDVTQTIMESFKSGITSSSEPELTDREKDILRLITAEHTSREIGKKLFISFHTVERHRKNIIAKLGVKNVAGLVKYAIRKGLVKDD